MELVIGISIGMVISTVIYIFAKPRKPKEPTHKHFFEPWSELLIQKMVDEEDGLARGRIVSQHRTCIECGFTEYRRDVYDNTVTK